MLPKASALSRELSSQESCRHVLASFRGLKWGLLGPMCSSAQRVGELAFATDSLEWFEWLCSLSSFRFIGHSGRFTAYREGQRSWRA